MPIKRDPNSQKPYIEIRVRPSHVHNANHSVLETV